MNGTFFIIGLLLFGYIFYHPELLTGIREFDFLDSSMTFSAKRENSELKEIALNITKGCDEEGGGLDRLESCYAQRIYNYVSKFDYGFGAYKNQKVYPVMETIKNKIGDCKNKAYTYSSLASQVGLDVKIKSRDRHMFPLTYFRNGDIFVTDPTFEIYGYWDDWKNSYGFKKDEE